MKRIKLAMIQLMVTKDKKQNIEKALRYIKMAKEKAAHLAVLPECFNSPYGTQYFAEYAEGVPDGETCLALSKCAIDNEIYIVGGSIPEANGGKFYNTCTVWNPKGELIAKYRKIHLFDIDIPGEIMFKESDVLSPGNSLTTFDAGFAKIGLGICYDLRFLELASIYGQRGCELLIYPGAFTMKTGPAHWELLLRARAVDNQLYVVGVSPAHDPRASFQAWGHSTIVDPFGEVIACADAKEEIVFAEIDLDRINAIRRQIPILRQRREDLYTATTLKKS